MESKVASAFGDDVLGDADAVEIARRIRNSDIAPREAVEAAIARCEHVNPLLNAVAAEAFEAARAAIEENNILISTSSEIKAFIGVAAQRIGLDRVSMRHKNDGRACRRAL